MKKTRSIWDSRKVRILMEEQETYTRDVAKRMGISDTVVSAWRHGREPSEDQVAELALILSCKPTDFYSEVRE